MDLDVVLFLSALCLAIIMILYYELVRKRKTVFWNWAGAMIFSIALAGTVSRLINDEDYKQIIYGVVFAMIGLFLYLFPKKK